MLHIGSYMQLDLELKKVTPLFWIFFREFSCQTTKEKNIIKLNFLPFHARIWTLTYLFVVNSNYQVRYT